MIRRVPALGKGILSRGCGAVEVDAAADMAINVLRVSAGGREEVAGLVKSSRVLRH
jgi:hypothetical protein